jgi:hypothetical protein
VRKTTLLLIVLVIGWYGSQRYRIYQLAHPQAPTKATSTNPNRIHGRAVASFKCDGRTHCSQMTSCEEAVFFINNCPNTKMDGDRDGIPCERQWCN